MKLTDGLEPFRYLRQFVTVAHPYVELLRQSVEEGGIASGGASRRSFAVLPMLARRDAPAEDVRQLLFLHHFYSFIFRGSNEWRGSW